MSVSDDKGPTNANEAGVPPEDSARADTFSAARSVKRGLLAELRASWDAGTPVPPEELLKRWPVDPSQDADVASLLLEDYLQHSGRGREPPRASYDERFPSHKDSLASVFIRLDALRSLGAPPSADACLRLPNPGDTLFGFALRRELGRGAFARVFLAEQAELAGRKVALKVSAVEGEEPQTLAQLQHTHIVPIYSVHEDGPAGLRALCMPYFGGASLAHVLDALRKTSGHPTRGEALVRALDAVGAPLPEPTGAQAAAPRSEWCRLSFVQTAAWIVARLAEGLQHAHERGVLHRDIKPSNILLGGDGQPMLLDFNLSQYAAAEPARASLGGTVAYMAPEHLRAMAARDPALAQFVDRRSDLYSLGMVFFEMLAGRRPFEQSASYAPLPVLVEAMALERGRTVPSPRAARPDVPWSVESILRRCLDPDPARRYQQAEHLAEDLRRFLDDRPLRYAPELSRVERARKWARRHPRLTSSGTICAAAFLLLIGAGFALTGVHASLAETRGRLGAVQAQERERAFEKGAARALFLVNTTNELEDHPRQGRAVCEETLNLYGILDRPDWQQHPDWRRLAEDERRRLAEDARELLLLLAGARVRLAPGDRPTLAAALELLDRAETIPDLPPCRALWEDRAAYRKQLGDAAGAERAHDRARRITPHGARDFYLLAMTRSRAGDYAGAIAQLDQALELNPRHYWAWVQRGLCRQERREPVLAAADFSACVGLEPDFAWGYFNRAYALDRCGQKAEAVADYTSALRRDPALLPAYLNRGLLRLEAGQAGPALDDFQAALDRGADTAAVHSGRGVALERLGRHREADDAFARALARADTGPRAARNRLRWVYGFAVAARLPREAEKAFRAVLDEEPNHPEALYGRAMLLEAQSKFAEALPYFNKALEAAPEFAEARRYRAVLLARLGRFREADAEIRDCLEKEPDSGATRYAAACIAALATRSDPREAARAVELLRRAFALGYGRDKAADDPDLDGIRKRPEFRRLLQESGVSDQKPESKPTLSLKDRTLKTKSDREREEP